MNVRAVVVSALVLVAMFTRADDAARGLDIAREADRRDQGFVDYSVELEMVLRNSRGRESRRSMRLMTLEVEDDGDKSLTIFDTPLDVRGTALLTHTHRAGPDDQWLNLPELKRVKRIASRNKSGPFVGSEFSFEDLASQEVEKYSYQFLREETCAEGRCFVIERVPTDKYSGYRRQVTWIDTEHYRTLKVEYFDRRDSHLKTLTFSGFRQYADRFWRADTMQMVNHQTGKSTELLWRNYRFGTSLRDADFNRNSLQRLR